MRFIYLLFSRVVITATGSIGNETDFVTRKSRNLINSRQACMRFEIAAVKAQIVGNSRTVSKIYDAAICDAESVNADQELIIGSLNGEEETT